MEGLAFLPVKFVFPEEGIGENREGGGRIHSIEMVDHGFGYDEVSDLIRIEGDGADLDGDGIPTPRLIPLPLMLIRLVRFTCHKIRN